MDTSQEPPISPPPFHMVIPQVKKTKQTEERNELTPSMSGLKDHLQMSAMCSAFHRPYVDTLRPLMVTGYMMIMMMMMI